MNITKFNLRLIALILLASNGAAASPLTSNMDQLMASPRVWNDHDFEKAALRWVRTALKDPTAEIMFDAPGIQEEGGILTIPNTRVRGRYDQEAISNETLYFSAINWGRMASFTFWGGSVKWPTLPPLGTLLEVTSTGEYKSIGTLKQSVLEGAGSSITLFRDFSSEEERDAWVKRDASRLGSSRYRHRYPNIDAVIHFGFAEKLGSTPVAALPYAGKYQVKVTISTKDLADPRFIINHYSSRGRFIPMELVVLGRDATRLLLDKATHIETAPLTDSCDTSCGKPYPQYSRFEFPATSLSAARSVATNFCIGMGLKITPQDLSCDKYSP